MAKRELSSTLKNLKFMQRAAQREEKVKKIVEEKPDADFAPGIIRKCVVIMEGDPHPGATVGRMSFGCFNPSVDKLNEDTADPTQDGASNVDDTREGTSFRENESPMDEAECSNTSKTNSDSNGNHKRKHSDVGTETEQQNKSPRLVQDGQRSSPSSSKGQFRQGKQDKLDWNVLRRRPQNGKR